MYLTPFNNDYTWHHIFYFYDVFTYDNWSQKLNKAVTRWKYVVNSSIKHIENYMHSYSTIHNFLLHKSQPTALLVQFSLQVSIKNKSSNLVETIPKKPYKESKKCHQIQWKPIQKCCRNFFRCRRKSIIPM